MRCVSNNENPQHLHPYCKVCGWRKGGKDSWDGKSCKCRTDNEAPPVMPVDPNNGTVISETSHYPVWSRPDNAR